MSLFHVLIPSTTAHHYSATTISRKLDLLPDCATYVILKLLSVQEAGDHDVALCEVTGTGYWDENAGVVAQHASEDSSIISPLDHDTALYTGILRQEGII